MLADDPHESGHQKLKPLLHLCRPGITPIGAMNSEYEDRCMGNALIGNKGPTETKNNVLAARPENTLKKTKTNGKKKTNKWKDTKGEGERGKELKLSPLPGIAQVESFGDGFRGFKSFLEKFLLTARCFFHWTYW